jgi:hypothetical protein
MDKSRTLAEPPRQAAGGRRGGDRNLSPKYHFVWTAMATISVALIGACLVFSYLTALSAESAKCAGLASLAGYRGGIADIFGLPLFSAMGFGSLFFALRTALKRDSTIKLIATADSIVVLQFLSIRVGYGMFGFVVVLLSISFMIGMTTEYCLVRYIEISDYCQQSP